MFVVLCIIAVCVILAVFCRRFFSSLDAIIDSTYIYTIAFEDNVVDRRVLKLAQDDVVATITTGGDNVLNLLIDGPKRVISADINRFQNYILEIKMVMLKLFSQREFFDIFNAETLHPLVRDNLAAILREMTDDCAAWFHENHVRVMSGFFSTGSMWLMLKLVRVLAYLIGLSKLFKCSSIEQQVQMFKAQNLERKLMRLEWIFWQPSLMASIGVPQSQLDLLKGESYYFTSVVKYIVHNTLLRRNYFCALYMGVPLSEECCPDYLKIANYELVRARLHRVSIRDGFLHDKLEKDAPSVVILLDHMDWMTEAQIKAEWRVYQRCCHPDARYLWRSASRRPYIACLNRLDYLHSFSLDHSIKKDPIFGDSIGSYLSTFVARIPIDALFHEVKEPQYDLSLAVKAKVFMTMMFAPFVKKQSGDHASFLNQFYRDQAIHYDGYRKQMLHGKPRLAEKIPFKKKDKVLILGCGTGDYVDLIPSASLSEITMVDLCEPLLEVARKRNCGKTVLGDITKFSDPQQKYDVIIITYTITMVPNWREVIPVIHAHMSPGAHLCVADFTVDGSFMDLFWVNMFSNDNVHLCREHVEELDRNFSRVSMQVGYGGFPFIPMLQCPYYYGVWRFSATDHN
jgi:S-adenosylmethionine-diacylglycerol 3-amino-3-carboxypropyl transferase